MVGKYYFIEEDAAGKLVEIICRIFKLNFSDLAIPITRRNIGKNMIMH